MPILRIGIEYELRQISIQDLFASVHDLQETINDRGWLYLKKLGYVVYKRDDIKIEIKERGTVKLIQIDASFEQNFKSEFVSIEVPLTQFEALVPHDPPRIEKL